MSPPTKSWNQRRPSSLMWSEAHRTIYARFTAFLLHPGSLLENPLLYSIFVFLCLMTLLLGWSAYLLGLASDPPWSPVPMPRNAPWSCLDRPPTTLRDLGARCAYRL